MDTERYRNVGRATVPRSVLEATSDDDVDVVDLLACALWMLLDALGTDEVRVETWTHDRAGRVWSFDGSSTDVTIARLLEVDRATTVSTDATTATASVRWVEYGALKSAPRNALASEFELVAYECDGEVSLELDTTLDRDVAPDALADLLAWFVREIAADPHRTAAEIPLVSLAQRRWLVDELNRVNLVYPEAATVDELVRQVATQTPEAVAIDDATESVTYAELLEQANVVADALRTAGARPGEAIGVMFPRSAECVAAMLGVLLVRGVYVPVPLEDPVPRQERLLDLAAVRLLLHGDRQTGISLTTRDAEGLVVPGYSPHDRGSSPLYIMFTSGSTGEPKAVVVAHRSVIRLVRDPRFPGFSTDDGVGFASNPSFDAATWEVWGALCNGARLIPLDPTVVTEPAALEVLIRSRRVTCLFLTTSLFNAHARTAPAMFGALRVLGIGGEAADASTCRRVLASPAPPRTLVNAYGPTESTTFASWHEIAHVPDGALRVPIGLPIVNTTLHVLDRRQRLVPPGVPGELFIGGDGLAIGYLDDPDLTLRKFVPDPFTGPPHRLYATGDLVVRQPDGEIVFLRRLDNQLKIRGFRVEPLEIEAAIGAIGGVAAAVVVPQTVEGYPRLIAYVIAHDDGLTPRTIREQLRADLPDYLVPSHVMMVDELPLTRSGKLDRARLPDPFASPKLGDQVTPHSSSDFDDRLTASITDVWREVLGLHDFDPDEKFFDAGGDSLLAVRLYGAVQRRFGVVLPSGTINQEFTLGRLVEAVREALQRVAPPLVTEMSTIDGPLIVLVAPGGGELDDYRWLVPALADRFRVVGVRELGHYGTEPRPRSMAGVSAVCVQALRDGNFGSPIAIIGECSGGILAHQLACDLSRDGNVPDLVVLLDTPVPGVPVFDDRRRSGWNDLVSRVRRRGRNALALTKMQTRWSWYHIRRLPAPPALAHSMTLRANARRVRGANPSYFDGRILYVQAVEPNGTTLTEGAPEYWSRQAKSSTLVGAPGSHAGPESFLSRSNAGITADAVIRELATLRGTDR